MGNGVLIGVALGRDGVGVLLWVAIGSNGKWGVAVGGTGG